jgi:hypothetical protein
VSNFSEVLANDALVCFTGENDFGEAVVYTKARNGGSRTVYAQVFRQTLEPGPGGGAPQPVITVIVANSSTNGIAASELDTGGDTVTLAHRTGGTARAYRVHLPAGGEHDDPGCLRLELR